MRKIPDTLLTIPRLLDELATGRSIGEIARDYDCQPEPMMQAVHALAFKLEAEDEICDQISAYFATLPLSETKK